MNTFKKQALWIFSILNIQAWIILTSHAPCHRSEFGRLHHKLINNGVAVIDSAARMRILPQNVHAVRGLVIWKVSQIKPVVTCENRMRGLVSIISVLESQKAASSHLWGKEIGIALHSCL